MKKLLLIVLLLIMTASLVRADEFNPQEIGYIDAYVDFHSGIISSETLDELSYSLYVIPKNYFNFRVISQRVPTYHIRIDKYGNKELELLWKNFESGDYDIKMRVKNYAEFSIPEKVMMPYNPPKDTWEYLSDSKYAIISDDIRNFAINLTKDSGDGFDAVTRISSWVHSNIKYDSKYSLKTESSIWVFQNRKGTCDEFTNLFIAMTRSIGIPARYVAGIVYSKDGWGYHAWAEVYLGGWIPVDPTWNEIGWIDATHIKLGNFLDANEVKVTAEYLAKEKPYIQVGQPSVSVNLINTSPINKKFYTTVSTYPKSIGPGKYAVVNVSVQARSNGCLATSIKIKPRVNTNGNPIISVQEEKTISICPGEVKNYYFVIRSKRDLDENYEYYDVADVYTFLGNDETLDLEVNPRKRKSSFLDISLSETSAEIGDKIRYSVVSKSPYKIYSDLPVEDNFIVADKRGSHYIIAVDENGDLVRRDILVSNNLDFKIMNIRKPTEVKCGENFNISFIVDNFDENNFLIKVNVSNELSGEQSIVENMRNGEKKEFVIPLRVIDNCTGTPQFVSILVNNQRVLEEVNVEKPLPKLDFIDIIIKFLAEILSKIKI
ncbi:MAG: transglutaminase domain-containing protein [Candidatus Aenigmarchaeota archaeon]|nr:transglutaminase domain-containing protein [Candidatus Aenigmarchaeota archaeon]